MKASDISPAVTRAMDTPWKGAGTSAATRRSRMAANRTSTREKPTAAPNPYSAEPNRLCFSCTFSSATPSTMQFVVMSGR